jgi:Aldo/keto reductase family
MHPTGRKTQPVRKKQRNSLYCKDASLRHCLFFICGWALVVTCVVLLDESHTEEFRNSPVWRQLANSWSERRLRVNEKQVYNTICQELREGSQHIDTVFDKTMNLKGVGRAINECYTGDRSDLFLITKVQGHADYKVTMARHKRNLLELGVEYVDLLVIYHDEAAPKHAWKATELMADNAVVSRTIGVSSYRPKDSKDYVEFLNFYPTQKDSDYDAKAKETKDEVLRMLKLISTIDDDDDDDDADTVTTETSKTTATSGEEEAVSV